MPRHVFHAMGTEVETIVEAADESTAVRALVAVEGEFERLERVLSRFRPDSALSRLNRDGRIDGVPDLARVVELALAARERTEGRFDPTVHDALVAAGYDRTFDEVGDRPRDAAAWGRACGGGVRVDGDRIELDPGVHLDLGGIGKGYAAERAADILAPHGPALVNAGGDVAVRGRPRAGSWAVGLDVPGEPDAGSRRGRPCHLRPRPPSLAGCRRGAPPPDRPGNGPPCALALPARHRRRSDGH